MRALGMAKLMSRDVSFLCVGRAETPIDEAAARATIHVPIAMVFFCLFFLLVKITTCKTYMITG